MIASARATRLVGGLALGLIAALTWFLLIGPVVGDIGAVGTQRDDAVDRNDTMGLTLDQLQARADDLGATHRAADELSTIFPPTADQPGFFSEVTAAARRAGIPASAITVLSPSAPAILVDGQLAPAEAAPAPPDAPDAPGPATVGTVAVQSVSMDVQAPRDRLQDLLARLEEMDRAFLVTSAIVSDDGDAVMLSLTGSTFVTPPATEPDLERAPSS